MGWTWVGLRAPIPAASVVFWYVVSWGMPGMALAIAVGRAYRCAEGEKSPAFLGHSCAHPRTICILPTRRGQLSRAVSETRSGSWWHAESSLTSWVLMFSLENREYGHWTFKKYLAIRCSGCDWSLQRQEGFMGDLPSLLSPPPLAGRSLVGHLIIFLC